MTWCNSTRSFGSWSTRCGPFCRERLGIYARERSDEIDDNLPIELDGLERWAVGDRVF